jgi:hypothetical protein
MQKTKKEFSRDTQHAFQLKLHTKQRQDVQTLPWNHSNVELHRTDLSTQSDKIKSDWHTGW